MSACVRDPKLDEKEHRYGRNCEGRDATKASLARFPKSSLSKERKGVKKMGEKENGNRQTKG